MKNKIIKSGLLTLGLASILVGFSLMDRINNQKREREYQEFSALYSATVTAQEIAGKDGASDAKGQELLDSLGIKYTLKENEKVMLDAGSKAAYVNIRNPFKEYGETRGFANKGSLDKYIANHQ